MAPNRNLFRLTRFIFLSLPALFRFFARFRTAKKRLLIIKTDAIGDYILFRNFIEVIKRSEQYQHYEVDLLGNTLWRDIALKYDADFVNKFLFTRADDLYYKPLASLKLGWRLFKNNYEIVLQPAYSRTLIIDGLAGLSAAKQIIGFESDTERIAPKYKAKTDQFYTRRLLLPANIFFEFERTKFFFGSVLNASIPINQPVIPVNNSARNGIVIVPGAGIEKRCWDTENFVELIKRVAQQTSQTIYLEGSPVKIDLKYYLSDYIKTRKVVNLIGKTSLLQLIDLIGNASLVIANETGPVHIAAATQTKTICITGGGHFERFAPYPEYMESKPICVYYKMDCYYCKWNCKFITAPSEPFPCISNVSLEAVWQTVQVCL